MIGADKGKLKQKEGALVNFKRLAQLETNRAKVLQPLWGRGSCARCPGWAPLSE